MNPPTSVGASYFGKLRARADFVKGGDQIRLIGLLDRWTSACMEALAENPRWKRLFDSASAVDFAFVAAHDPRVVIGHLIPSHDAAGRRFPFLAASMIELATPRPLGDQAIGCAPLWASLRRIVGQACPAENPDAALGELASLDCKSLVEGRIARDKLACWTPTSTLGELAASLGPNASARSVRRQILALGVLLQPVMKGALQIQKNLCLPLPANLHERDRVAAFWLKLVAALLRARRCELQLLLGSIAGHPCMVIGFNGASPRTLLGVLAPMSLADTTIVLGDPAWIESHPKLATDRGVARLSSYLAQPAITLEATLRTFTDVFLGA